MKLIAISKLFKLYVQFLKIISGFSQILEFLTLGFSLKTDFKLTVLILNFYFAKSPLLSLQLH
jgi:hypothetical protein